MPADPRHTLDRIERIKAAWLMADPKAVFSGMTHDQFSKVVQPSIDARVAIAQAESQLSIAKNQRVDGDKASAAAIQLVVNAVKGDPKHGDDGKLYEAMGYVRRSECKSGLTRPRKATVISVAA